MLQFMGRKELDTTELNWIFEEAYLKVYLLIKMNIWDCKGNFNVAPEI